MPDLPTTTPEQLPLAVVLTCCTCDRGRLGCPDPDCGGWTFTSALTVPSTTTGGAA